MSSEIEEEGWFFRTVSFLFFCESKERWIDVLFALLLLPLGVFGLIYWYSSGLIEPGFIRGAIGWLIFVFFLSKPMNLIDCGGPIPSSIFGFFVVFVLENWAKLT